MSTRTHMLFPKLVNQTEDIGSANATYGIMPPENTGGS